MTQRAAVQAQRGGSTTPSATTGHAIRERKKQECHQNQMNSKLRAFPGCPKCHPNPSKSESWVPPGRPKHLFNVFIDLFFFVGTPCGVSGRALGSQREVMATPKVQKKCEKGKSKKNFRQIVRMEEAKPSKLIRVTHFEMFFRGPGHRNKNLK